MQVSTQSGRIEGSCHCTKVRLVLAHPPLHLIQCNCSICSRLGARWAHYPANAIIIEGHPEHTSAYVWGSATLKTLHCTTCGCVTHWEALSPQAGADFGVNMNNFDNVMIKDIPVRHFDGASTWTYLD